MGKRVGKSLPEGKAQGSISPLVHNTKKNVIRGLGFLIFVIGAYFIITAYLGKPIVGYAIQGSVISTASVAGVVLEIIGIVLMFIKFDSSREEAG